MTTRVRTDPALVVGAAMAFAVGMVIGVLTGADFVLVYAVSMALVMALVVWIDARVHFSRGVLWGLVAWLLGHLIGGLPQFLSKVFNVPGHGHHRLGSPECHTSRQGGQVEAERNHFSEHG